MTTAWVYPVFVDVWLGGFPLGKSSKVLKNLFKN